MAPLTNNIFSQLSLILLAIFVLLFRKQLSGKATDLVSRTLHVRHPQQLPNVAWLSRVGSQQK